MTPNELLTEAKTKAQALVQDAIQMRVDELKDSPSMQKIIKQCDEFMDNPYNDNLYFDECAMLCSMTSIDLGDLANEDKDVIEQLLESITDNYGGHFVETDNEWAFHQCLGDATIINVRPERNCYAIYSSELGLAAHEITSEDHGLAIVEQAMRKAGIFGDIVSTDYYGSPTLLSVPEYIRNASDEYLKGFIEGCEVES